MIPIDTLLLTVLALEGLWIITLMNRKGKGKNKKTEEESE